MVYFFVKIKVKYCLPYPLRPRSSSRIKQSLKTSFIQQKILSPAKLFPVSKDTQKCIAQGEQGERPLRPCLDCPPCWDLDNSIRGRKIRRQRMAIQKENLLVLERRKEKGSVCTLLTQTAGKAPQRGLSCSRFQCWRAAHSFPLTAPGLTRRGLHS